MQYFHPNEVENALAQKHSHRKPQKLVDRLISPFPPFVRHNWVTMTAGEMLSSTCLHYDLKALFNNISLLKI